METKFIQEQWCRHLRFKNLPAPIHDADGNAERRLAAERGGSPEGGAMAEGGALAGATNRFGECCFLLLHGM
jgi:hypothetical protein